MADITAPTEQIVVEPRPGAEAPPAAAEPTGQAADLPDELLQIPAFQAITAGQPGAFSAILEQFQNRPEAQLLAKNKDALMKAGFGLYRAMDGQTGVVSNQLFVSPDEIKAADKAGQLPQVAPPFDQVNAEVAKLGADSHPSLTASERPTGFKQTAPLPAAVKPLPSSSQKTITTKRETNLQPTAPTSGPKPGGGRLLNSILKPVL